MTWLLQTLNVIIFVFGVFLGVYEGIRLANIQKQKLPEHRAVQIEQFARQAVQSVEQQSKTLSGPAKKQLAIAAVSMLCKEYDVVATSADAVDVAIESAVNSLPKTNG